MTGQWGGCGGLGEGGWWATFFLQKRQFPKLEAEKFGGGEHLGYFCGVFIDKM
jgi:hypothetical protein